MYKLPIAQLESLIIISGAGMGVDSGLPDFRGTNGFWRAYPVLAKLGIDFEAMATPAKFIENPRLSWGFYGHRLNLYRTTRPHAGFDALHTLVRHFQDNAFIITSNVDGQFQEAGFSPDMINEDHGSIHHLQCSKPCRKEIWSADGFNPHVDEKTCQLLSDLPLCPHCGALARPNILMFSDSKWVETRWQEQDNRQKQWLSQAVRPLVIEIGAGSTVGSMRSLSEHLTTKMNGFLVRINPREPEIPSNVRGISIPSGGRDALTSLVQHIH